MILGLDCATKTGWCLLRDGKVYESGVQDFSKTRGESNGAMFLRFRHWLAAILAPRVMGSGGLTEGVHLVIYELPHHRGGAATEIAVNMTGRIQEMCTERGLEYVGVHTATLKKFATGRGNADKADMIAAAKDVLMPAMGAYSVDLDRIRHVMFRITDDQADAIMLAVYGHKEYGVG